MANNLVIVESPTKVKAIKKFLGSRYEVMASGGHVRDLPKSQMGFDPEHDFEPKYITIRGKGDVLAALRKAVKKADKIYLATDPDREGEAIAWHLQQALKLSEQKDKQVYRITFNEITKNAVKEAIRHPRQINMNMVDAQQARRILDRMVGYKISPLLWAKIKRGLSAGRVQSAALRIIADREKQINDFIPEEYWTLEAVLGVKGEKKPVTASFYGTDKKLQIRSKQEADRIMSELESERFEVRGVKKSERVRKAPLPFTTSTLQQEASRVLNFSTQKTMRVAQQLYEGIELKGEGTVGLITYLRTDSTRISDEADAAAKEYIRKTWGDRYVTGTAARVKTGQNIQDAHEAIRPSDITREPMNIKDQMSRDQFRLYQLIWRRFAASRMEGARYETTSVSIGAGRYVFKVSASRILFEGYQVVYTESDENKESNVLSGNLSEDSELTLQKFNPEQHFTQPPAHYTEASLVKTLEELGIGRPSTYAPTITTLLYRRYIIKEQRNLYLTELGEAVNNMMKEAFPQVIDVNFTANLEQLLDYVGDGRMDWKEIVRNIYPDLDKAVAEAEKKLEKVTIADEVTDVRCDLCGRNMVVKYGPHGKFLACPGFPECKNTKPYLEKAGVKCPKCGHEIIIRRTKKGRRFYGCENPECDFMSWQKPSEVRCPKCGGYMVEKGNKLVCASGNCGYILNRQDQPENSEKKEPEENYD